MTKKLMVSLSFSGLFLLASVSQAQIFMDGPLVQKNSNACAGAAKTASDQAIPQQPLVFYALSEKLLMPGSAVKVEVLFDGQTLATESFTFEPPVNRQPSFQASSRRAETERVVFELFDLEPQIRAKVFEFSKADNRRIEVAISVDGALVTQTSFSEFLAKSEEVRKEGILPTVTRSPAQLMDVAAEFTIHQKIYLCGDGSCDQGGRFPEDCDVCPEDCGGPCSICGNGNCSPVETCSSCAADCGACCPNTLPDETRNEIVSVSNLGLFCLNDVYFWDQGSYYSYDEFRIKATTYSRVRECNGSITERPISVAYHYSYCYQYYAWPCGFPWGWPSCVY